MASAERSFVRTWRRLPGWLLLLAFSAVPVFLNFRKSEPLGQSLFDTAIYLALLAIPATIILLVERLLAGRTRLWARIGEISIFFGMVCLMPALGGGSTATVVLAGAFWLFVTGGLILLAALQPDVTT